MTTGTREPNPAISCTIATCYYLFLFGEAPRKGAAYIRDGTRYEVVRVSQGRVYLNSRKYRGFK